MPRISNGSRFCSCPGISAHCLLRWLLRWTTKEEVGVAATKTIRDFALANGEHTQVKALTSELCWLEPITYLM